MSFAEEEAGNTGGYLSDFRSILKFIFICSISISNKRLVAKFLYIVRTVINSIICVLM